MRGNKNLVEGGYRNRIFSSEGMNKILAHWETPIFSKWGNGGVPPVGKTLIFRLLLFKQTTYITRVLTRPERWCIMLLSQSALIPNYVYTSFRN